MYLYIEADLTTKQSPHGPDEDDLVKISDGELEVIEFRALESAYYRAEVEAELPDEAEGDDETTYSLAWEKVPT